MELLIFRSLWGHPESARDAAESIEGSVYDGLEAEFPLREGREKDELSNAILSGQVPFIPLLVLEGDTPSEQMRSLLQGLESVLPLNPHRVIVHSGRDWWTPSDGITFYRDVVDRERDFAFPIAHETHRGTSLATPWITREILEAVPSLQLCCDFSHWVVVCERLLEDQASALRLSAARCAHVHARVGFDQGPQIPDPAAPSAQVETAVFESWWKMVWDEQERSGSTICTLTPEYGPPPYQHVNAAAEDLPEILNAVCDWQAQRARSLFAQRGGQRAHN